MQLKGRIIKGVGGQYWIADGEKLIGVAMARGIFRKQNRSPVAGDWVRYASSQDPDVPWVIEEVLPRRNLLVRPPLANLDGLVITLSLASPQPDFYLADKLLTVCRVNDIEPLICLTKLDLADQPPPMNEIYRQAGVNIITTSPDDEKSMDELRDWMKGRFISFAGQSGVGKSTLLNRLFGREMMPTGNLSEKIGRGKHTTRHVELFPYRGGYIADTPGFSILELSDFGLDGEDLLKGYPEIEAVADQCRFTGCRHLGELGCALNENVIHPDRLERYRFFRQQLDNVDPYGSGKNRPRHRN